MRYLLAIILAVASLCPAMAQVTGGEYFIDTDPGYGKATAITINSGSDITKDFTVGLSAATPGFHTVSVRAHDAQGRWSHTLSHSFYIIATPATNVIQSEYFIDTDPGYGRASIFKPM